MEFLEFTRKDRYGILPCRIRKDSIIAYFQDSSYANSHSTVICLSNGVRIVVEK